MAGCLRLGLTDPYCFFFFNDTATTEIYTLSLHDALPISRGLSRDRRRALRAARVRDGRHRAGRRRLRRALRQLHGARDPAARGHGLLRARRGRTVRGRWTHRARRRAPREPERRAAPAKPRVLG